MMINTVILNGLPEGHVPYGVPQLTVGIHGGDCDCVSVEFLGGHVTADEIVH